MAKQKYLTKSFYIRVDQAEWLSKVAEYNDKTQSKLVELAIDNMIELIEDHAEQEEKENA